MKSKSLLIYIKEINDAMNLTYIGVSIYSPFQLKTIFGLNVPSYKIDFKLNKQFFKAHLENEKMVADYQSTLIKELEKYDYNNCNVIVNVDLTCTFDGYILLPNLSGKALNDSLNQELQNIYGSFLDFYACEIIDSTYEGSLRKISVNFININDYKQLLDFISINNFYRISRINYIRDSFNNLFLINKMKNTTAIGVFIDEETINLAVYNGNQTICSSCLDFGFSNLFNFKNDAISINDDLYNQIIEAIMVMMYSNRINLDISNLLIIAPASDSYEIKKVLLEKFSKFMENPKYVETNVEHNYLVDMAIVKNRKIRKLPLRVKI
ncbi:MAG: hypothetical protein ACI32E_06180 [Bacilli bacterium]